MINQERKEKQQEREKKTNNDRQVPDDPVSVTVYDAMNPVAKIAVTVCDKYVGRGRWEVQMSTPIHFNTTFRSCFTK